MQKLTPARSMRTIEGPRPEGQPGAVPSTALAVPSPASSAASVTPSVPASPVVRPGPVRSSRPSTTEHATRRLDVTTVRARRTRARIPFLASHRAIEDPSRSLISALVDGVTIGEAAQLRLGVGPVPFFGTGGGGGF